MKNILDINIRLKIIVTLDVSKPYHRKSDKCPSKTDQYSMYVT
jgi:hypothetical protein